MDCQNKLTTDRKTLKNKSGADEDNGFAEFGGYMEAKIAKLEQQFREQSKHNEFKKSDLFSGISIFVNGWTNPSATELKQIMLEHGGVFHHYQRTHTTFIIASNLPDVKIRQKLDLDKIISAKWVVDCLKENRILDYSNYLLYTNKKASQPTISFTKVEASPKDSKNFPVKTAPLEDSSSNSLKTETTIDKLQIEKQEFLEEDLWDSDDDSNLDRTIPLKLEDLEANKVEMLELESNERLEIESHSKELVEDNTKQASQDEIELTSEAGKEENDSSTNPSKEEIDLAKALSDFNAKILNSNIAVASTDMKSNTKTVPLNMSNKARTATDPNFLSEFFNHSRLHHIASLGASFKLKVSEWRREHNGKFPAREILKTELPQVDQIPDRIVMHIDMDCFFVSVGLRTHPHLKGFPIAVTHSKGGTNSVIKPGYSRDQEINMYKKRMKDKLNVDEEEGEEIFSSSRLSKIEESNSLSEIASCSYEARKCGVKNGMFVGAALKLCPNLKTIPYDFEGYKSVSTILYSTIAKYTLDIEAVSCDEMFVDLTSLLKCCKIDCMDFVSFVRNEIRRETSCPCSAGVGSNRLQARMATKKAKPDGQFYLTPNEVQEFMKDILITDLPGVGYSTAHQLKQLNWKTCADLENVSLGTLQQNFGKKFGETLFNASRGIDDRPLTFEQVRKSVSVEVNYGIRFKNQEEVDTFMRQLVVELINRLKEIGKKAKQLTLKLMIRAKDAPIETMKFMGHGVCDSISKSLALPTFTDTEILIESNVLKLLHSLNIEPSELRGIGIQLSKFEVDESNKNSNTLLNLFKKVAEKKRKSNEARDEEEAGTSKNEELPQQPDKKLKLEEPKEQINPLQKWMKTSKETSSAEPSKNVSLAKPETVVKKSQTVKSPAKKRGRPPKNASFVRKPSNSDISVMFSSMKAPKKASSTDKIDPDVLMELPEEIRNEILNQYKEHERTLKTVSPKKLVKDESQDVIVIDQTADVPELKEETNDKMKEVQKTTLKEDKKPKKPKAPPKPSADNILMKPDWRPLLTSWIEFNKPNVKDVEMLIESAYEMIGLEKMNDLFIRLKFLFRVINESQSCTWHQIYFRIVKPIQDQMKDIFNSKLYVEENFNCEFCVSDG